MIDASERARQLANNLDAVKSRIARASAEAAVNEPELIVVTKYHPAQDVRTLFELGVHDVGENRDQEAAQKSVEVAEPELRWHFIGQLQKNKAKSVVRYAHSVQSIDRASLIASLGNAMRAQKDLTGRADLRCLLQVDLAEDAEQSIGRGGVAPSSIAELAELISATHGLVLDGLMAVAPLGVDPKGPFERLAQYSSDLVRNYPQAAVISAGMSHDLEQAIAAGATHLRVGSDVLGPRPPVL